jgi:hypothetical protein
LQAADAQRVIDQVVLSGPGPDNQVLLDFGDGDSILLQGLSDTTGLAAAIDIV